MRKAESNLLAVDLFRERLIALTRRMKHEGRCDDATWTELMILGSIERNGLHATPSRLAASENMRSSNVASTLRKLEQRGLIHRVTDEQDRRKVRLELTKQGVKTMQDGRALRNAWLSDAMAGCLTDSETRLLLQAGLMMDRLAGHSSP